MRIVPVVAALLFAAMLQHASRAHHSPGDAPPIQFASAGEAAVAAASPGERTASAARVYLRSLGCLGLDALDNEYRAVVAHRLGEGPAPGAGTESAARILASYDAVSGQHDGWASGLYWHTDRCTALRAAKRDGVPVLNLWLLGRLDDEFC